MMAMAMIRSEYSGPYGRTVQYGLPTRLGSYSNEDRCIGRRAAGWLAVQHMVQQRQRPYR
jgi:hypothetical protein